jgi:predicted Fe-Mo cluster-binding NifX family protein
MTVAIPIWQERVSPVLDTAGRLLVVTRHRGREVSRRQFILAPLPPSALVSAIVELGVDVLICGALSQWLEAELWRSGVQVIARVCGEIEPVLLAHLAHRLDCPEFRMPGCCGHLRRTSAARRAERAQPHSACEPWDDLRSSGRESAHFCSPHEDQSRLTSAATGSPDPKAHSENRGSSPGTRNRQTSTKALKHR